MYIEMKVNGFTLDSIAQMPLVLLKDVNKAHALPIWINTMDAVSIAAELISRDMSAESGCSDLLTKLLSQMRLKIDKISIDDLNDVVFDVSIVFAGEREEIKLSVRPSEAVVMALKYDIPLHVAKHVLSQCSVMPTSDQNVFDGSDERRFVDFLESLDPKDLGKYPM
jgi:bifunctional DNase/RNase